MTEWRREYFDIFLQYCSRFGVLVLLASSSNIFCVACSFTGFHITFFLWALFLCSPRTERKGCTNYHFWVFWLYMYRSKRWLLGGLSGPTVMWSSTKTANIMWPLFASPVMGMSAWCCEFLGITVNLDSASYSPLDVATLPSPWFRVIPRKWPSVPLELNWNIAAFHTCQLFQCLPPGWGAGAVSSSAGGFLVRKDTQVFRPDSESWLFTGVILINFFF